MTAATHRHRPRTEVRRTPGDLVLHPVALASLVVLVGNDHALKGTGPGWLTGKLSDVAGLAFLPFLLLAAWDAVRRRHAPGVPAASTVAAATAVTFAAVKLVDPVREVAAWLGGVLRVPLDALAALVTGAAVPPFAPVAVVADPTDVLAVIACGAVVLVVRRRTDDDAARGQRYHVDHGTTAGPLPSGSP